MRQNAKKTAPIIAGLLIYFALNQTAQAQGQSQQTMNRTELNYRSDTVLGFQIEQLGYTSDSAYDSSSQQRAQFSVQTQSVGSVYRGLKATLGTYSEPNSLYLSVPEAYIGFGQDPRFVLGRVIRPVSEIDQKLHFGVVNPYFSNDYVRYENQGLFGIHIENQSRRWNWGLSWLTAFIPNQGPQITVRNNEIYSSNRWATRPPTSFQFGGENKRIDYAIQEYKLLDIVENPGAQARLSWNERLTVSYAYKPVNDITLSRETYGTAVDFKGRVELTPTVTYHEVATADFKIPGQYVSTTFSFLQDRPQNQKAQADETLQNLSPLQIYGVTLQSDLSDLLRTRFLFSISAARVQGGEIKDLLQDGSPSVFTFSSQRTLYRQPLLIELDFDSFLIARRPLQAQMRWIYDSEYKGSVLSAQLKYQFMKSTQVHLGADLLGTESQTAADSQVSENFIEQNSSNDRIFGGLEYVF